jgi:hypothetical protein
VTHLPRSWRDRRQCTALSSTDRCADPRPSPPPLKLQHENHVGIDLTPACIAYKIAVRQQEDIFAQVPADRLMMLAGSFFRVADCLKWSFCRNLEVCWGSCPGLQTAA